ncbi:MAG: transporter, YbiR family [Myxococcales bacterium]|nr:transporter, YbiR family [Myxococcales bacterium]
MAVALIIFSLTYLVISGQRIPGLRLDRPSAALCGAVFMVLSGTLTLPQAYAAIDLDTITLLLGMMIIAAYLAEAAFFRTVAHRAAIHAGSARGLLFIVIAVAGLASTVLVNDTVCLMMTPIVLAVVRELELPPLPYLLAVASASNIGGVMTLTGNPQNMIIATASGLSYTHYTMRMAPVALGGLALDALILAWMFRRDLPPGPLRQPRLQVPQLDRVLVAKSLVVLVAVVVGFVAGRSMPGMALAGAAILTLIARAAPRPVFSRIDWPLLLFFGGLFVVIDGAAQTGLLTRLYGAVAPYVGTSAARQLVTFGLFSELGANIFSNVPYVLVARHFVPTLARPEYQWTGLAMCSTLAGNLTIVGSVANLIVLELAGPENHIGFFRFLRYGAVITIATTALGLGTLLLEMRLGW